MPDSLHERVISLERMVADLRSATDSIRARDALQGGNIPYRLARVTNDPVTGDNCFSIVFLDGTYNPVAGQQTAAFTQRQLSAKAVCYNLNGSVIDKDQEILVFPWDDRWWTWHGTGSAPPATSSEVAVVEVFDSYVTPDLDPVNRLPEWVYNGRKINPALTQGEFNETDADDPWLSGEDIWLVDVSHGSITTTLLQNERYLGYKLGTMVIGQVSRPIYAIRHYQEQTAIVEIYDGNYEEGSEVSSSSRIWGGYIMELDASTDIGWDGEGNYTAGKLIWLVDVNRIVKRETLQNNDRFVAVKVASTFDHEDDPRELWAIKDDPRPAHIPFVAFAVNDVEHHASGTFKIATGTTLANAVAGLNTVTAFNPLAKIWANSRVVIDRWSVKEPTVKEELAVIQALSATRIRGTATTSIAAGGVGTLTNVIGIDGHYNISTASVTMPTSVASVPINAVVWAELRYVGPASQFYVYQSDCAA